MSPEDQDLRDLFDRAGVINRLPWFIRAWLWSLQPVATKRSRIVVAVLAGCVLGSALTIAVPAFVHLIESTVAS